MDNTTTTQTKIEISPDTPRPGEQMIKIHTSKGVVGIVVAGDVIEIHLPGMKENPAALVDLYYLDIDEEGDPNGPPQITIYSPEQTDDPLAFAKFYPGQTRVSFETHVSLFQDGGMWVDDLAGNTYMAYEKTDMEGQDDVQ